VTASELVDGGWDEVVVATGVLARQVTLPGADRPNVHCYADVITGAVAVGERVAVIGAGGIGFDVSEFLMHTGATGAPQSRDDWMREWREKRPGHLARRSRRGHARVLPAPGVPAQRKASKIGAGLGRTSGWVHRGTLQHRGVEMIRGVAYQRVDDAGLHITVGTKHPKPRQLEVDDVVICAGQESRRDLLDDLCAAGTSVHVIGGADVADEVDAKRAIDQGTRLAAAL